MDPNFKEDDESGANTGGSASGSTSGAVKLDAAKATDTKKKKGCC